MAHDKSDSEGTGAALRLRPGWRRRNVRVRGDIAVFTVGVGRPVLIVHGFPDHPIGLFNLAEDVASHGFQCIVPALPGFWLSSRPADGDFTPRTIGRDLVCVLDDLDLASVAYVGHDWGAELGYPLMAAEPTRFSSFTALGTPHPLGYGIRRSVLHELRSAWYAYFLAYAPDAAAVARSPEWLTALMQTWSPGLLWPAWPDVVATYGQPGVLEAVCAYYRANLDASLEAPVISMPSLLIHGGQDGCISPNNYPDLAAYFPGGVDDVLLPEVGHWPHIEAPGRTMELLLPHLGRSF